MFNLKKLIFSHLILVFYSINQTFGPSADKAIWKETTDLDQVSSTPHVGVALAPQPQPTTQLELTHQEAAIHGCSMEAAEKDACPPLRYVILLVL